MRLALRAAAVERFARRTSRRVGVILVYHRIGASGGSVAVLGSQVSPRVFDRQLSYLADRYRVVALADLVEAVAERRARDRFPVALTLDDDLGSHVQAAAPALRAARVPATFFLTGASLSGARPFWWDDLAQSVDAGALGEVASLPASLVEEASSGSAIGLKALARSIERLQPEARAAVAKELRRIAGPPRDEGLPAADVASLARSGFEVGFHTLRHDPLMPLDDGDLAAALRDGREALEAAAGVSTQRIAYPHGRADARVAAAARTALFVEGFTGAAVPVTPGADSLLLPRYQAATTLEGLAVQVARAVSSRE
jgi:peptidoglycan/xylan/chitin deacetylase (PgdA/CDA1 family)